MELKFSKVTRKGPITIVTLARPEVYNALHIEAHFELNKVFDDFCADPEQWVAIVTGAGDKAFCAGNDLKWQAAGGKRGWDKGGFAGLTTRRKKKTSLLLLSLVTLGILGLSGCCFNSTTFKTYTINITGTSANSSAPAQSTSVILSVGN